MTLTEQVYAQALLMAGDMEDGKKTLLELLCQGATTALTARLRDGLTPEDCRADFVAAASMLALAGMNGAQGKDASTIKAGDFSLILRDTASQCLHRQAEMVIAPYLKDRFAFLGV